MTVEITKTGLPELPEGHWWRIGEISDRDEYGNPRYGTGGWASSTTVGKMDAVQIMTKKTIIKNKEVPVYGSRWWNKGMVVGHEREEWLEEQETAAMTRLFTGYSTRDKNAVPKHAHITGGMGRIGEEGNYEHHYEYFVNADGARAIAERMIVEYRHNQEAQRLWEIAEQARKEANSKLFGDYPPKTLEGSK